MPIDPRVLTMLKGVAADGALGAGVGAAGMGAANMLGEPDAEGKKNGLLKSMLLGGALGGVTGAGGRIAANAWNPALARDSGSAVLGLFSEEPPAKAYEAPPHTGRDALSLVAEHPWKAGAGVGAITGGVHKYHQGGGEKSKLTRGDRLFSQPPLPKNLTPGQAAVTKYLRKNYLLSFLAGMIPTTAAGYVARPMLEQQANYDDHNNPDTLRDLIAQRDQPK